MGWTLQEIAELLGHEDINTTRMYVTVKTETIESKYRRCM
jgi:site-specific recombinase XerD